MVRATNSRTLRGFLGVGLACASSAVSAGPAVKNFDGLSQFGNFSLLDMSVFQVFTFCIGVKKEGYTIRLNGATVSGSGFQMSAGSAVMTYVVEFASNGSNYTSMTPGIPLAATTVEKSCSMNSPNVSLRLTLLPGDFNVAPVGI